MARALKQEDYEICILEMRQKGIFGDLLISDEDRAPSPSNGENGAILLTCSDGHLFSDVYFYLLNFFDFIHPIAVNGGPLLMNFYSEREFLLKQLREAKDLKNFRTVITASHWPCGVANKLGLTVKQALERTFIAEQFIKYYLKDIRPILGYSVDYRRFTNQNCCPRVRTYKLRDDILYSP